MYLGTREIITPLDNPAQFDPDWRNSIARELAFDSGLRLPRVYAEYANDRWIRGQVRYLRAVDAGRRLNKDHDAYRYASLWYQGSRASDVKFKLEPLLLTSTAFDIIALDIGGGEVPAEVFKAYERLYFNIRRDDGDLHKSCQLRTYFSTPDTGEINGTTPTQTVWKVVGANLGYESLAAMWLWTDAHGLSGGNSTRVLRDLWRVAQSMLFMDLYMGRVSHRDLGDILSNITNHERMRFDTSRGGGEGSDTLQAMLDILNLTKPHMLAAAKKTDEMQDETKAIQARLSLQSGAMEAEILDNGIEAGEDAVNDLIAANFKNQKTETS